MKDAFTTVGRVGKGFLANIDSDSDSDFELEDMQIPEWKRRAERAK